MTLRQAQGRLFDRLRAGSSTSSGQAPFGYRSGQALRQAQDEPFDDKVSMHVTVRAAARIRGTVRVPGDKSVSHRAAIFNSIAEGSAEIRGFLQGDDCLATVACMRAMGADLVLDEAGTLRTQGAGLRGLREPATVLDAQNSGTTMRLLTGILAGQPSFSVLSGDESLRRRPRARGQTLGGGVNSAKSVPLLASQVILGGPLRPSAAARGAGACPRRCAAALRRRRWPSAP